MTANAMLTIALSIRIKGTHARGSSVSFRHYCNDRRVRGDDVFMYHHEIYSSARD